jgi:NADH-quinone oxidoreductase subunit M
MVTGMMPGLVLEYVAAAQRAVGLPEVPYMLGGVASAQGTLDMLWISGILFAGFAIGAILFYGAGKSRRVHQLDNYAGGHFLTADVRYQYSDNFYAGLMHRIGPLYRGSFQWLENALVSGVESAGMTMQGFYRQVQPAGWVLVGATVALIWVVL